MRTLILIVLIVGMMSLDVTARSSHRKLKHQNEIFMRHLQSSERSTITMNQSFAPKGQSLFPKVRLPILYAKHTKTKKSNNTLTSMK
jgi:hypothetical protein